MSIDFDRFLSWAESRFDDVAIKGDEILVNSIFCEDRKKHMWCNPSGGKTGCKSGVYHCWKTNKSGSLIGLVMLVEKCPYEEAVEILGASYEGSLEDLERRVMEIFERKETTEQVEKKVSESLSLPENCYLFDELPSYNEVRRAAMEYLESRKIDPSGLFVCTKGRYRNRILIPYYDMEGNLFYYNGRLIGSQEGLRYLGPPKELGIGKGDVIFVPKWPSFGEKIYITEGEFDALALRQAGFNSAALGGKLMSERQMNLISGYFPVLCLDADDAGGKATAQIASYLLSKGMLKVHYVRPSKEYKDWNGLFVAKGPKILSAYLNSQEKDYNPSPGTGDWESLRLKMNGII